MRSDLFLFWPRSTFGQHPYFFGRYRRLPSTTKFEDATPKQDPAVVRRLD